MSAIAGILHLDGRPAGAEEIDPMVDVLAHRGGDGSGTWWEGPVALGGLTLHVTPESLFEEPLLVGCEGRTVVAADIRLDNREELLGMLGLRSPADRPVTDPELVLSAYVRWGERCPERLLGAFAIAIWDASERRLFLARDHFGVKPLVYAHLPGRLFAFASEAKALLNVQGVSDALDDLAVAKHLLAPVHEDVTRTVFRDIRSVAPAHTVTVGEEGFKTRRYWALDPEREVRLPSDDAYAEEFRNLFEEAVRCRLRSVTEVSAIVSGGLDSSSVASMAATIDGPLPVYSAVFPATPASDESDYINAVVAKHNLPSYRFSASDVSPLAYLDEMQWYTDRPLTGGNDYLLWTVYGAAAAAGSRVVLDGFDGDTTVSHGLGYFNELRAQGHYVRLAREVMAFAEAIGEPWQPAVWSWLRGPVLRLTGAAHVRRARRAALRLLQTGSSRAVPPEPPWKKLLSEEFARRIAGDLQPPDPKFTTERQLHHNNLIRPLMVDINEVRNIAAAAASLEVRLPFFDKRLIEFCLALPPSQKLRSGQSRFVLRQAMAGVLPEKVRLRGGKTSMQHSFDRGLRHFERDRIKAVASRTDDPLEEYLSPSALRESGAQYLVGAMEPMEDLMFWRAFTLTAWLRRTPRQPRSQSLPPFEPTLVRGADPIRAPLGTYA